MTPKPPSDPKAAWAEILAEQQTQLGRVHAGFLQAQGDAQRRYLETVTASWQILTVLAGAENGLDATSPAPTPTPGRSPATAPIAARPSPPAAVSPPRPLAVSPPLAPPPGSGGPGVSPGGGVAGAEPLQSQKMTLRPTSTVTGRAPAAPAALAVPLVPLVPTALPTLATGSPPIAPTPAGLTSFAVRPDSLPGAGAEAADLPGPKLDRAALEAVASSSVPAVLGPALAPLDAWDRVVRMPEPPLLLADRVTGIQGPIGVLGRGTIWTETDITPDRWFLHEDRMPGGILIESGQADLLLASWQGVDLHLRGERVYRLLGCDLRYERPLPRSGETLSYRIDIDGHAQLGGIRMFFFHYDCFVGSERQITVRQGQAGFFTEAELASSGGILWDPTTAEPDLSGPMEPAPIPCDKRSFEQTELQALAAGRVSEVLGPAFAFADTHTLTPRIQGGDMLLFDRVTELDREGGPWKRGYLRAELDVRPDHWFFDGHFKNDPCMPGTLMFDGCLGAMYLYLQTLGVTVQRDGWRFEPMRGEVFKLRCRGQVIPTSERLVYEIFVQSFEAGPIPRLRAQILCTVDGLRCFHADPLTVELVPDWPLDRMPAELVGHTRPSTPPPFDYRSLLACAWGRPSEAFGAMYADYDVRRVPRLPGPPYHFMSRVPRTEGVMGGQKAGGTAWVEYDVPPDAWYFAETGGTMPWAVLLETALQPCGWLTSWNGNGLHPTIDLLFRNLDGKVTVHRDVLPDIGTLCTRTTLESVNRSGGMVIVSFDVKMTALRPGSPDGDLPVLDMKTVFGFFPPAAFANQVGLPPTDEERAFLTEPSAYQLDLRDEPARFFAGAPRLPVGKLRVLDRVTGYWPDGGKAGLGKMRGEKDVITSDWFFKAHFFQDPVQPGSLGLEALVQLVQAWWIERGLGTDVPNARFEPIATGVPFEWRYRGQVVPKNKLITSEIEILAVQGDLAGPGGAITVLAEGWLWVDGKRIYRSSGFGVRVVSGILPPGTARETPAAVTPSLGALSAGTPSGTRPRGPHRVEVEVPVPVDHAPTWVLPSLPMTGLLLLALQGTGGSGLRDAAALRWLAFPDGPRRVGVTVDGERVTLDTEGQAFFVARSDAPGEAPPVPALRNPGPGRDGVDLYASAELFHGPAFHVVERVEARGDNGATLTLRTRRPDGSTIPPEVLLDGATHGIRHDHPEENFPDLPPGQVGYPARVERFWLYAPPPEGPVRCEVRAIDLRRGRPVFAAWFFAEDERLIAWMQWEEVLLPKGPLGLAPPLERRSFLLGNPTPGVSLTRIDGDRGVLSAGDVAVYDWLPGSVQRVYDTTEPEAIAVAEVEAARRGIHPRALRVEAGEVFEPARPLRRSRYGVRREGGTIQVVAERPEDGGISTAARERVAAWWTARVGEGPWEAWLRALSLYFGDLVVTDPAGLAALRGRPALFCANHETYLESVIFTSVISALQDVPVRAMAKREHGEGWLGALHDLIVSWPKARHPGAIVYFQQQNPAELPELVARECQDTGLLVHVEGTRQTVPGQPVERISSLWMDVAIERGLAVVPVAFRGGIGDGQKHDVPMGAARQDAYVGRPISPDELRALPYAARRRTVADAINGLGLPARTAVGQPEVEAAIRALDLPRPVAAIRVAIERAGVFAEARAGRDEVGFEAWGSGLRGFLGLG